MNGDHFKSISELFEIYCYFRVAIILNYIFYGFNIAQKKLETKFVDSNGVDLSLRREPVYWTYGHAKSSGERFINSEGWTVKNNSVSVRGNRGKWAQRSPDITIELNFGSGVSKIIVMDAKYTRENIAFVKYLPELTMKYVHGLHRINNSSSAVCSLTVLYPNQNGIGTVKSFHHKEFGIFGRYPVSPSLQCLSLIVGRDRHNDQLNNLMMQLLSIEGIACPLINNHCENENLISTSS